MVISLSASSIPHLNGENLVSSVIAAPSLSPLWLRLRLQLPAGFLSCGNTSLRDSLFCSIALSPKKQMYNSFDDLLAKSENLYKLTFTYLCGPCQFMVPIFNEVSIRLKDTIQGVKIDTEKLADSAIQSLKTSGQPDSRLKVYPH
ncbi:hypothetical protein ACJRO7_009487 [Eucalyptus globulus]|uniref:Thioredoxin domain-containing protein n=1 Tax=Eucalyptus globulus TaxID=34317 RepID=A0ABD3L8U4_EUCGL